jgi:hypothetical protein
VTGASARPYSTPAQPIRAATVSATRLPPLERAYGMDRVASACIPGFLPRIVMATCELRSSRQDATSAKIAKRFCYSDLAQKTVDTTREFRGRLKKQVESGNQKILARLGALGVVAVIQRFVRAGPSV